MEFLLNPFSGWLDVTGCVVKANIENIVSKYDLIRDKRDSTLSSKAPHKAYSFGLNHILLGDVEPKSGNDLHNVFWLVQSLVEAEL